MARPHVVQRSPAALARLLQARPLSADRGVVPVLKPGFTPRPRYGGHGASWAARGLTHLITLLDMGLAAKLIKTARLEAGLTIAELGQRAGTSKPTISRYENGIVDPGSETLNRLLRACGRELTMTRSYLPRHVDELRARFENAPGPTKDDVTRTVDGRELRTAADVSAFIAELRADGHLTA